MHLVVLRPIFFWHLVVPGPADKFPHSSFDLKKKTRSVKEKVFRPDSFFAIMWSGVRCFLSSWFIVDGGWRGKLALVAAVAVFYFCFYHFALPAIFICAYSVFYFAESSFGGSSSSTVQSRVSAWWTMMKANRGGELPRFLFLCFCLSECSQ